MQSHYFIPWPTVCEWHCIFFPFQTDSSYLISCPIWPTGCKQHCAFFLATLTKPCPLTTESEWTAFLLGTSKSHPMITECVWHCIFYLQLVSHHSSHDQQHVSTLHLCQTASLRSHTMTNRVWVKFSLPGSLTTCSHDQQSVRNSISFLWKAVSFKSYTMINREWVL